MPTDYPDAIDTPTNPEPTDTQDAPSHAGQHADANDAIVAIQTELGTNPAGSAASVAARLDAIEGAAGFAQVGTFDLPETPSVGESVTVLASSSTTIPSGVTWDSGGEPVVVGRLLISCVWSGSDWVCTYGLPFAASDTTDPTPGTLAGSSVTSDSFTLTISGATDETALDAAPYDFSLDNGGTWEGWQAGATFAASGLTSGTAYTCMHRVRDSSGNVALGTAITVTTGVLITDAFNRANAGTLGTTDTGETWVPDAGSTWGISSNSAYKISPDADHTCALVDLGSADMTVSGTVAESIVNPGYPGIAARATNADTAYLVWFQNDTNRFYLVRRIAGVQTILDDEAGAIGNTVTLSTVEEGGSGTRVIAKINGTEFANILDTTSGRPSATKAGIFAYRISANHRVDNFSAETVQ